MDPNPVRNLQIISSPGVGGRELVPPLLARELQTAGHPTWLAARPGTLVERWGLDLGLRVWPTKLHGYADLRSVLALAAFLRQEKIQIIHAHWSRDLSNLILASGLSGRIPIVLTKHVYATEPKRDPFHTWVYRHTDRVLAVSQVVAENVRQTVRIETGKVLTVYNGLDLRERWNRSRVATADLRAQFGVPAGAPILGFAGRLNAGKGPHLVLEAFARLASKYPLWHLVLVGRAVGESEENYLAGLREIIQTRGLARRVHLVDYRTDMPEVMRTFDVLACPSVFESFGMVVIEAMAMGCAVVGSDSGGIPEIISSGVNGALFAAGDSHALAVSLEPLLAKPEIRQRLGEAGWKMVCDRFSLEHSARQVYEIYQTLLKPQQT
ncbi:MAG: glycosyltransferase family 4 protein [Candidatus Firestonebacteria bacterium]|nr:glycosyltransferase family 4 protein [Candidatus Firestonebacteria bacterium]